MVIFGMQPDVQGPVLLAEGGIVDRRPHVEAVSPHASTIPDPLPITASDTNAAVRRHFNTVSLRVVSFPNYTDATAADTACYSPVYFGHVLIVYHVPLNFPSKPRFSYSERITRRHGLR